MAEKQQKGPQRGFSQAIKTGATHTVGCATGACAGFRDFILRGNVVDLAVAVVVGTTFTALINALVSDWLTPLIAVIFGTNNTPFGSLSFTVRGSVFNYGHFVNALLTFAAVCSILYFFVVLPLNTLTKLLYKPPKKTRECPECCSDIPRKATRCKFCCAAVPPFQPSLVANASSVTAAASTEEEDVEKGVVAKKQAPQKEASVKGAEAEEQEEDEHEVWRKAGTQ